MLLWWTFKGKLIRIHVKREEMGESQTTAKTIFSITRFKNSIRIAWIILLVKPFIDSIVLRGGYRFDTVVTRRQYRWNYRLSVGEMPIVQSIAKLSMFKEYCCIYSLSFIHATINVISLKISIICKYCNYYCIRTNFFFSADSDSIAYLSNPKIFSEL